MFLSPDELKRITGYKRGADQIRWLNERAWSFEVSATGKPVVSKAYAEAKLGLVGAGTARPNFAPIR